MTTKEKVLVIGSLGLALVVTYMVIKKMSKPKLDSAKELGNEEPSSSPKGASAPSDPLEVKNKYGEDCYSKKFEVISDNAYYYVQDKNFDLVKEKKIPKGTIVNLWDKKSHPFFVESNDNNYEVKREDVKYLGVYDFNSKKSKNCDCENYIVNTKVSNLNKNFGFHDKNGKYVNKVLNSIPKGTIIEISKKYRENKKSSDKNYWNLCDGSGSVSKNYIKLVN
jgi:hypothetical protein